MEIKLFKIILFVFIIAYCQFVFANDIPEFNHFPPNFTEKGITLPLELEVISGIEQIKEVYLFYRKGNLGYIQIYMENGTDINPIFNAEIPGDFIDQDIEYYFRIIITDGEELTLPSVDAINNPFYVPLKVTEKVTRPKVFKKLSPADEFNFTTEDFMVAISYFIIEEEIKEKIIKLIIDGIDVTDNATVTANMLVYKPERITEGRHSIKIAAYNDDESIFESDEWIVFVKKGKITQRLPITINGDFSLVSRLQAYSADDSSYYYGKEDEWKNFGRLNLRGGKNWFRYKGRVYFSSEEDKSKQPVNRYSLEMHIPHLALYLGDQNQSFANNIISGKNIRGYGGEVKFGFFKLHSFYGQIKRNIRGSIVIDTVSTTSDTTITDTSIIGGTYKRNCLGLRLQFGNERKFVFGLSALKVKDDMESEEYAANPKDNIVVGLDTKLALFRQRVTFGAEISTSLLNNDISEGVISEEDLDTLGVELPWGIKPAELENIIIVNKNMEPLKPPNLSSIAGEVYGRIFFLSNLLNVKYSYVGGSYNSLANPYLQKDKAGFNIRNSLRLLNNQINLTAGYNSYEDNLSDNKTGTTEIKGLFANIGYYPQNDYLPCISFNYQQSDRIKDTPDSLYEVDQANSTLGFSTSYRIPSLRFAKTRLSFNVYNSNSVDNKFKRFDVNSQNYQFSVNSVLNDLPLSSKISFSYMKTEDTPEDTTKTSSSYIGLGLREDYSFIPNILKSFLEYRWTKSSGSSEYTKNYISLGVSHKLKLFGAETFLSGEVSHLMYKNKSVLDSDYNQTEFRFKISQKF